MKFNPFAAALVAVGLATATTRAEPPKPMEEPGWLGVVFARGDLKKEIDATPILERPYRPLHVYGNTVRRNFYRGTPAPRVRDVVQGTGALVTGR